MKKIFFLFVFLTAALTSSGHFKPSYTVIIDTDGGMDDIRAINLFMASPQFRIAGIICSNGISSSHRNMQIIRAYLKSVHHEGIPVVEYDNKLTWTPPQRKNLSGVFFQTKDTSDVKKQYTYDDIYRNIDKHSDIDYIALGALSGLTDLIRECPRLAKQVDHIHWFNENLNDGFNYKLDSLSFRDLLNTDKKIFMVSDNSLPHHFPWKILKKTDIPSRYQYYLMDNYKSNEAFFKSHAKASEMKDELIALSFLYPGYFDEKSNDSIVNIRLKNIPSDSLHHKISGILTDHPDKSIVFTTFPKNKKLFSDNLTSEMDKIIHPHGLKEWKVVCLTNEFHEHLGIYSILGAKMGMRARDYFRVGIDELVITSNAGLKPPLSCMNDGLQASTGATLGHGTISVSDKNPEPSAVFQYNDRTITIRLKKDIKKQITLDVVKLVATYGLGSPEYWTHIEKLGIHYWSELSRHSVFETIEHE
jgi:pyrimidine-specific ribonucleoside hydrolase